MTPRRAIAAAVALVALAGCSAGTSDPRPSPSSVAGDPAYDIALSEPVEDRVYPEVGDPGVDALHYDLDLAWDPEARVLEASEVLTFRATEDDTGFQLDLSPELDVGSVTVDGEPVEVEHVGKDLRVTHDVIAEQRYQVALDYSGTPQPVDAPTSRADVPALGWTTTADGSVWTMQEPFGAYTWYAVNDQPSDKALYDFTLRVPHPMTGVANGELVSDSRRTTEWHLAEPAASYLITVAFGDYVVAAEESASGLPISVWMPRDRQERLAELRRDVVESVDWSESVLGDYPFDTLGFLFVDSTSGMETQTMVTLGLTDYTTSPPVLVHEAVHQWWGNQVTPRDWRDLWMNEGMTMYLQAMWESEHGGEPLEQRIAGWAADGESLRDVAGPPAAYDRGAFAESNVYYLPAVMWHEVRAELGDEEFFRLVREWPASRDNGHADYDEIVAWWSQESGTDLAPLFDDHLLGEDQPA
jgi:aminopeptidase N